jgi:hypothetical protein
MHLKKYYENFENYFSDSDSDSSSGKESDSDSDSSSSEENDGEYKEKSNSNIGEKDEIKCIKKLFKLNILNKNKKLEDIFGKEANGGIEIIDPDTNKQYKELTEIKKTSSSSKADVCIKMKKTGKFYNSSIKSFTGSNPAILNHTPRKANVFQKGILYKELSNIDIYVNEYIENRNKKEIGEDINLTSLNCFGDKKIKEIYFKNNNIILSI